jgi:hypothetical protein
LSLPAERHSRTGCGGGWREGGAAGLRRLGADPLVWAGGQTAAQKKDAQAKLVSGKLRDYKYEDLQVNRTMAVSLSKNLTKNQDLRFVVASATETQTLAPCVLGQVIGLYDDTDEDEQPQQARQRPLALPLRLHPSPAPGCFR